MTPEKYEKNESGDESSHSKWIDRFEIIGHDSPRPVDADQIIFCDGTGGGLFHAERDLELSHWRPNRTFAEYRAGTSTEICFRFLDDPRLPLGRHRGTLASSGPDVSRWDEQL